MDSRIRLTNMKKEQTDTWFKGHAYKKNILTSNELNYLEDILIDLHTRGYSLVSIIDVWDSLFGKSTYNEEDYITMEIYDGD